MISSEDIISILNIISILSQYYLNRYLSKLEKEMVAKVILGLKNVQYLSVQAVADNDLSNVWIILNNLIYYFLLVYE